MPAIGPFSRRSSATGALTIKLLIGFMWRGSVVANFMRITLPAVGPVSRRSGRLLATSSCGPQRLATIAVRIELMVGCVWVLTSCFTITLAVGPVSRRSETTRRKGVMTVQAYGPISRRSFAAGISARGPVQEVIVDPFPLICCARGHARKVRSTIKRTTTAAYIRWRTGHYPRRVGLPVGGA